MMGFELGDEMDELTVAEIKAYANISTNLHESAAMHGMIHFANKGHSCDLSDYDDDVVADVSFSDAEVRAYLAYEDACLIGFSLIRRALRKQGFPLVDGRAMESDEK